MSDGNFNRNLLPYNNYQSGLRAGRAQMKHLALTAFRDWYKSQHAEVLPEELDRICEDFKKMLD